MSNRKVLVNECKLQIIKENMKARNDQRENFTKHLNQIIMPYLLSPTIGRSNYFNAHSLPYTNVFL